MKSLYWLSGIGLILSISPAFAGENCASVSVVPGTSCGNLGVRFDLSACGESAGEPEIRCLEDGSAEAVVVGAKHRYTAHFHATESWGQKVWTAESSITRKTLKPKTEKVARVHHKADRSPAALMVPKKGVPAIPGQPPAKPLPAAAPVPSPSPSPAPTVAATPAPEQTPTLAGLSFNGFFDMYLGHNFNRPQPTPEVPPNLQLAQNQLRAFDLYSNSFALNLAELSIQKKGKEVSFHIDLDFGQQADAAAGGTSATPADDVSKAIGQAFVTWNPADLSNLTVNAGKMYTFLGFETAKSKDNWNYSRSLLFTFALPVWHTGANATYAFVPGVFSLGAHIYNGWNTLYGLNSGKTYGLQAAYNPNSAMTLNFNLLTGPQKPNDTSNYKTIYEGTFQWTLSPSWSWVIDGVAGHSSMDANAGTANGVAQGLDANFQSAETLAKYSFTSSSFLSPRLEYFWDPRGAATATDQDLWEGTLTLGHAFTEGLESRVELRYDHSNASPFIGNTGTSDHQTTAEFALLYSF